MKNRFKPSVLEDRENFRRYMLYYLRGNRYTLKDVAERVRVSVSTVWRWEAKKNKPSNEHFKLLIDMFKLDDWWSNAFVRSYDVLEGKEVKIQE